MFKWDRCDTQTWTYNYYMSRIKRGGTSDKRRLFDISKGETDHSNPVEDNRPGLITTTDHKTVSFPPPPFVESPSGPDHKGCICGVAFRPPEPISKQLRQRGLPPCSSTSSISKALAPRRTQQTSACSPARGGKHSYIIRVEGCDNRSPPLGRNKVCLHLITTVYICLPLFTSVLSLILKGRLKG
jgi:hypothetical protein